LACPPARPAWRRLTLHRHLPCAQVITDKEKAKYEKMAAEDKERYAKVRCWAAAASCVLMPGDAADCAACATACLPHSVACPPGRALQPMLIAAC
jgi:hypothetical protein